MSDPKTEAKPNKPQGEKTAPNPLAELPRGIPVKVLRLMKPMNIPGYSVTDVVNGDLHEPNRKRWTIEYVPQMRHHKIIFHDPTPHAPAVTFFVHETHVVTWEPMPQ